MANSTVNGGKVRVEGIQTVVPTKPTDPRKTTRIIVPQNLSSTAVLQRRVHLLLCYNMVSDKDSGWIVAGRIKESLGKALQDHPLLAGRLRPSQETDGDLQIVTNDSGVRLVEAKAAMELSELKGKTEIQSEFVFWEDVVDHNPQFSPLFYVQVTNFTCGGYSIGISCSLLLADPFVLTTFIKKWAHLHNNLISIDEFPKNFPTFYLPNHGKSASSPALLMGSNTTKDAAHSVIFKIPTKILNLDDNIHKNLAALCINQAERDVGRKLASNLSLFLKVPFEDDKVEVVTKQGLLDSNKKSGYSINGMSSARTWDELELESVCFSDGNKPVYASCWINSVVDEGSVIIAPSTTDSGVKIVISFN